MEESPVFELLVVRLMIKGSCHKLKQPREWACHLRDKRKQALLMPEQKVILTFSERRGEEKRRRGRKKRRGEKEKEKGKLRRGNGVNKNKMGEERKNNGEKIKELKNAR